MAKPEPQIEDLKERLRGLLADWGTEIPAVIGALDRLNAESKQKDVSFAELETKYKNARARIEELERKLEASDKPAQHHNAGQQAEFEAMRTELAARKSLVKNMRADAERGKALEKELAYSRDVIATMKESIEADAKTIAELKLSANRWERKYRKLAEAGNAAQPQDNEEFSYSTAFSDTGVAMFLAATNEVSGTKTVVIDMTEPLREARDERRRQGGKE